MQAHINNGELVGATTMIARVSEIVLFEAYGDLRMDTGASVERDSISGSIR